MGGIEHTKGSLPLRSHSQDQPAQDYKHRHCEPENFACLSKRIGVEERNVAAQRADYQR